MVSERLSPSEGVVPALLLRSEVRENRRVYVQHERTLRRRNWKLDVKRLPSPSLLHGALLRFPLLGVFFIALPRLARYGIRVFSGVSLMTHSHNHVNGRRKVEREIHCM